MVRKSSVGMNKARLFCARVIVEETTRGPAGHEVLVLGSVRSQRVLSRDAILLPVDGGEQAQKGIMVILVDASEDNFLVRLFNPGQEDCVVRQGTMAGYITPVSEIDIEYLPRPFNEGHESDSTSRPSHRPL